MENKLFLLVTANDNETNALLEDRVFFKYDVKRSSIPEDVLFYNVGKFGKYDAVHFELPQQGSAQADSSLPSVLTAIDAFHPDAVILIGVAFGKGSDDKDSSQHIGDVLISTMVADYESGKIKDGILKSDGSIPESGRHLSSIFKHYSKTWPHNINGVPVKCEFGLVLSGDKVVDDVDFKQKLFNAYPRAIGGEMEGRGAYAACRRKGIDEWIIVKGICDWGDGTKSIDKEQRQIFAGKTAVSLLKHIFSDGTAFDKLPELNKPLSELNSKIFSEPDSAAKYRFPNRQNRFYYSMQSAKFSGRGKEEKQLMAFCGYDKDMHPIPTSKFSWWLVSGEGGSGKSRLCFEFSKILQEYGWTICPLTNHSEKILYDCSTHLPNKTLFILDYSEFDMGVIVPWLLQLYRLNNQNARIRVLLLQRREERIEEKIKEYTDGKELMDSLYSRNFLHISSLSEDSLLSIITSYAFNARQKILTIQDANMINEKLKDIDKTLSRPLYAQILTDAYCDDPAAMSRWNREDALDYICEKEVKEIFDAIEEMFKSRKTIDFQDIQEFGLRIICMATMIGGINMDSEFGQLMPNETAYFKDKERIREKFFLLPQLFSNNGGQVYCPALEPDIIGEYFVIKYWKQHNNTEQMINAAWKKPYYMNSFVTRLFQDHESILLTEQKTLLCNVNIPEGVTYIEKCAYKNCRSLISITLPDSIKLIEEEAFQNCSSLTRIIFPRNLLSIGKYAFQNCGSLTSITLPDSIESIDELVFSDCISLTDITLPKNLKSINRSTFYGCSSLTNITLPDSIESLGVAAFCYCNSLNSITFPKNLISIEKSAFRECRSLTSIILPENLKTIGITAFQECVRLINITLPDSIVSIKDEAFSGCISLTGITLPDSISSIESNTFDGCMGLTSITLPYSISSIESGAFNGCRSLTNIVLPDSINFIKSSAFRDCRNLTSITFPRYMKAIDSSSFYGCTSLTVIILPDSLESIESWAFSDCISLTNVTLPDSIKSIGNDAFIGCNSLRYVYVSEELIPIIKKSFRRNVIFQKK